MTRGVYFARGYICRRPPTLELLTRRGPSRPLLPMGIEPAHVRSSSSSSAAFAIFFFAKEQRGLPRVQPGHAVVLRQRRRESILVALFRGIRQRRQKLRLPSPREGRVDVLVTLERVLHPHGLLRAQPTDARVEQIPLDGKFEQVVTHARLRHLLEGVDRHLVALCRRAQLCHLQFAPVGRADVLLAGEEIGGLDVRGEGALDVILLPRPRRP